MRSIYHPRSPLIVRIIFGEPIIVTMIAANAIVLFLDAFPTINRLTNNVLHWIDYGIMVYFVVEAIVKISILGFRGYWENGWNRVDFVIVLAGLPLLIDPFVPENLAIYGVLPLLRLGRFLRFLRIMRFVPNATHIGTGVVRALKASLGVFLVLFGLNMVLAMGATMLFGEGAPQYFGNPLISLYSLFKVFTVEGWFEIPDTLDEMARQDPESHITSGFVVAVRIYFIVSVLLGGILGLSLANAVFVDEMTIDNTADLERMVSALHTEVQLLRTEVREMGRPISDVYVNQQEEQRWQALQSTLDDVQRRLTTLHQQNDR